MGSLADDLLSSLRLENAVGDDLIGDVEEALASAEQSLSAARREAINTLVEHDHLQRVLLINQGFASWRAGMQALPIAPIAQQVRNELVHTLTTILDAGHDIAAMASTPEDQTSSTDLQRCLDLMFDASLVLNKLFPDARPARLGKSRAGVRPDAGERRHARAGNTSRARVAEHPVHTGLDSSQEGSSATQQEETVAVARSDDDAFYTKKFDRIVSTGGTSLNGTWIRERLTPELRANLPRMHFGEIIVQDGFVINGDVIGGDSVPRGDGREATTSVVTRKDTAPKGLQKVKSMFKHSK